MNYIRRFLAWLAPNLIVDLARDIEVEAMDKYYRNHPELTKGE